MVRNQGEPEPTLPIRWTRLQTLLCFFRFILITVFCFFKVFVINAVAQSEFDQSKTEQEKLEEEKRLEEEKKLVEEIRLKVLRANASRAKLHLFRCLSQHQIVRRVSGFNYVPKSKLQCFICIKY